MLYLFFCQWFMFIFLVDFLEGFSEMRLASQGSISEPLLGVDSFFSLSIGDLILIDILLGSAATLGAMQQLDMENGRLKISSMRFVCLI